VIEPLPSRNLFCLNFRRRVGAKSAFSQEGDKEIIASEGSRRFFGVSQYPSF
jgi:hypothetical protein